MILPIDSTTVAVFDSTDLANAIAMTDVNYIYLGANITLSSGITITPTKTSLVIDGFYPLDGTGVTHQFTDMNSIYSTDTLGVRSASSINLTLKNMSIIGRNYYGVPYVVENTNVSGVTVTYENVSYSGPQMIYNPYGITQFFDCDISIAYAADPGRVQEVGEVSRVVMGGTVNINHTDTGDAVFWFRGNRGEQSFTVLEGANVTINSNSYFMFAAFWNVVFYDALPVAYNLQPGCSFILNTSYGISLNSTHQASTFLVDSGATFVYTQSQANTTGTYHTLYLNNSFTVGSGAKVYMQADFATNSALIRFNAANASLHINEPKSCVFYSRGVDFSFSQSTSFEISGGQLNYWRNTTALENAGTIDDIPASKWHKEQYALSLEISGTTTSTATTVSSNNFTAAELNNLPALSNLHLYEARILSVGDVILDVNRIVDDQTPVSGLSDPNANIRVIYTTAATQTINSSANDSGEFSVSTPEAIPALTPVNVFANIPFLIVEKIINAENAGELTLIEAPARIKFIHSSVSVEPLLLSREFPNAPVIVSDNRVYSTPWTLSVSIATPLSSPSGHTIPDGVVFVENATVTPLSINPLVVYTGEPNDGTTKITECTWAANNGVLLHPTVPILMTENYSTFMRWDVAALEDE